MHKYTPSSVLLSSLKRRVELFFRSSELILSGIYHDMERQFNDCQYPVDILFQHVIVRDILARVQPAAVNDPVFTEMSRIVSHITVPQFTESHSDSGIDAHDFLSVFCQVMYASMNPLSADRLGVVYTPSSVADFMIRSTDQLLQRHCGCTLGQASIIDPCVGIGTFLVRLEQHLGRSDNLHGSELHNLPWHIVRLLTSTEISLCDTLETSVQPSDRPLVVIGNPPYNANQSNENDNNKNKPYPHIDERIRETYLLRSTAKKTKLYDMYVRFVRWASDQVLASPHGGIVALITNNSYIDARGFDGFRQCLAEEFDELYIVDLKGNARKHTSDQGGNIFGIKVGVSVMFAVKSRTTVST